MIKVVVLGDQGVGKSTLIANHCPPLFGSEASTVARCGSINKSFVLVDSRGVDRFRTLTNTFYRAARGILLVYDVTEKETFEHIPMWMAEVRLHTHKMMPVVLVANKCDAPNRVVGKDKGAALAVAMEVPYIETDKNRGLTEALEALVEKMPAVARTPAGGARKLPPGTRFRIKKKKGTTRHRFCCCFK